MSAQCSFLIRIWILIIRIPVTLILKSLLHGTFPWNVEYFKYYNPQQCTVHLYTVQQARLSNPGNYWLKEQALSGKIWKSPVITGSKNKQCQARSDNTRQLLDLRTSTIRQDLTIPGNYWLKEQVLSGKIWQNPAITGSKNKYCPERSDNTRQLLFPQSFLWTVQCCMTKYPVLPHLCKTVWIPGNILVLL